MPMRPITTECIEQPSGSPRSKTSSRVRSAEQHSGGHIFSCCKWHKAQEEGSIRIACFSKALSMVEDLESSRTAESLEKHPLVITERPSQLIVLGNSGLVAIHGQCLDCLGRLTSHTLDRFLDTARNGGCRSLLWHGRVRIWHVHIITRVV